MHPLTRSCGLCVCARLPACPLVLSLSPSRIHTLTWTQQQPLRLSLPSAQLSQSAGTYEMWDCCINCSCEYSQMCFDVNRHNTEKYIHTTHREHTEQSTAADFKQYKFRNTPNSVHALLLLLLFLLSARFYLSQNGRRFENVRLYACIHSLTHSRMKININVIYIIYFFLHRDRRCRRRRNLIVCMYLCVCVRGIFRKWFRQHKI